MKWRIGILKDHNLGIREVQDVIAKIDPLDGAREMLDKLRREVQCVILSDTFEEFALPLVEKLGMPPILCNNLTISDDGFIESHNMRITHSKLSAVRAFQSINYDTIAVGDSYNDLEMLNASKKGILFNSTPALIDANPQLVSVSTYDDLYREIKLAL